MNGLLVWPLQNDGHLRLPFAGAALLPKNRKSTGHRLGQVVAGISVYFCGNALAKQQKVYRGEPWRADCHLGLVLLLGKKGAAVPKQYVADGTEDFGKLTDAVAVLFCWGDAPTKQPTTNLVVY